MDHRCFQKQINLLLRTDNNQKPPKIFLLFYHLDHQLVYWDSFGGLSLFDADANQSSLLVPASVIVILKQNNLFKYLIFNTWFLKSFSGGQRITGQVLTVATFCSVSERWNPEARACRPLIINKKPSTPSTTLVTSMCLSLHLTRKETRRAPIISFLLPLKDSSFLSTTRV